MLTFASWKMKDGPYYVISIESANVLREEHVLKFGTKSGGVTYCGEHKNLYDAACRSSCHYEGAGPRMMSRETHAVSIPRCIA